MNGRPTPADIPRAGLPYLATAPDSANEQPREEPPEQQTAPADGPSTAAADSSAPAHGDQRPPADRLSRWQYSRHVALGHAIRSYSDMDTRPGDIQLIETARMFERWIRTGER